MQEDALKNEWTISASKESSNDDENLSKDSEEMPVDKPFHATELNLSNQLDEKISVTEFPSEPDDTQGKGRVDMTKMQQSLVKPIKT